MKHLRTALWRCGIVACLGVAALTWPSSADAGGVHISVGIGLPFPVVVAPAPVVTYPAPVVVYRPAPVIVSPPPVVVHGGYYGHRYYPRRYYPRHWHHHHRW